MPYTNPTIPSIHSTKTTSQMQNAQPRNQVRLEDTGAVIAECLEENHIRQSGKGLKSLITKIDPRQGLKKKLKKPAINKEIPYYPSRHQDDHLTKLNLNGKVPFPNASEEAFIECRHLVTQRVLAQANTTDGKFRVNPNFETLESRALIPELFTSQQKIEIQYENLIRQSPEVHLLNINDIGSALYEQFNKMKASEEPFRLLILNTHDHVMSLRLRIKQDKNQNTIHVVEFYDPNKTATHLRMAHSDISAIDKLKPSDLIPSAKMLNKYFPSELLSQIELAVVPKNPKLILNNRFASPLPNRALASGCPTDISEINPNIMNHLIAEGFSADLKAIKPILTKVGPQEAKALLSAQNHEGHPGMYSAMVKGFSESLDAYGDLLVDALSRGKLSQSEFANILLAKKASKEEAAISIVLKNGDIKTASAYGGIIAKAIDADALSRNILLKLVDIREKEGNIGEVAFKKGQTHIVNAYEALMQNSNARTKL